MFSGIGPEREEPGRRRAITWLFSHCTPAQLHGVGFEAFQKRVRPPTVERKDKRAARSEVRSEEAAKTTKKLKRRKKRSCIGDFCWDKDCIFFSFFFFFFLVLGWWCVIVCVSVAVLLRVVYGVF